MSRWLRYVDKAVRWWAKFRHLDEREVGVETSMEETAPESPADGPWWEGTVEGSPDLLLVVTARTGWLWHVIWDNERQRTALRPGNMLMRGRALCRKEGRSGWQVRLLPGTTAKRPPAAYPTMEAQWNRHPAMVCIECWNRLRYYEVLRESDHKGWAHVMADDAPGRRSVS